MPINRDKLGIMRARIQGPKSGQDAKLERVKNIAAIFSAVAIPLVLTIAGYFIQRQLASEGLKKDYVGIAAGILKENPATQEPELRSWAIAVLEDNSPVPFSNKAKAGLLTGMPVVIPGPAWQGPPDDCRKPPSDKRTVIEEFLKLSKESKHLNSAQLQQRLNAFLDAVLDQEPEVLKMKARLECIQVWTTQMEQSDIEYRNAIGAPSIKSELERIKKRAAASVR